MPRTDTYNRILEASAKLFALKGFEGTTTREIAKEAHSSLSSIQNIFENKEKLFLAVMEHTVNVFYDTYNELLNEIDEIEKHGYLDRDAAWDMVVQLVNSLRCTGCTTVLRNCFRSIRQGLNSSRSVHWPFRP